MFGCTSEAVVRWSRSFEKRGEKNAFPPSPPFPALLESALVRPPFEKNATNAGGTATQRKTKERVKNKGMRIPKKILPATRREAGSARISLDEVEANANSLQ